MSVISGPSISTSGLVFDIDMSNTQKSFLGPPLTNNQWNSGAQFDPWTVGGINIDVTGTSEAGPVTNSKTWKFIKTGTSSQWNGWEGFYGYLWNGSPGDIWSTSYWYKTSAPAGNTVFGIGAFVLSDWSAAYNVTNLANVNTIIADGQWHYNYTVTQINQTYTNAIIADGPSWPYTTSSGTLYINGLQWNKNAYAGPFAAGTRSTTQTVVDLTKNYTMTATSLTYAYDGLSFSFNGTTDYIDVDPTLASQFSGGAITISTVAKISSVVSKNNCISFNGAVSFFLPGNQLTTTNQLYWDGTAGWKSGNTTSWNTNQWYHLAWTISGTTLTFYVNGIADGSATVTAFAPSGPIRIGLANAGEYATGSIGLLKLYNRALSQAEILQDFNAYRSRFGI